MADTRCPVCGCQRFYVKNPEDEFDICEFDCIDGRPVFDPEMDADQVPHINEDSKTFCNKCAWHGRFGDLGPK